MRVCCRAVRVKYIKRDMQWVVYLHDLSLSRLQSLVQWCRTNQTRGLERWTCKSYGTSRGKDASGVKHAVLLEQARQFLANERDEEEIARVAEQAFAESRGHLRHC